MICIDFLYIQILSPQLLSSKKNITVDACQGFCTNQVSTANFGSFRNSAFRIIWRGYHLSHFLVPDGDSQVWRIFGILISIVEWDIPRSLLAWSNSILYRVGAVSRSNVCMRSNVCVRRWGISPDEDHDTSDSALCRPILASTRARPFFVEGRAKSSYSCCHASWSAWGGSSHDGYLFLSFYFSLSLRICLEAMWFIWRTWDVCPCAWIGDKPTRTKSFSGITCLASHEKGQHCGRIRVWFAFLSIDNVRNLQKPVC